jgi:hypothetical protein
MKCKFGTRLLNKPDAMPATNFTLHISQLCGCKVSILFHKPGHLAHQVDDRFIFLPY